MKVAYWTNSVSPHQLPLAHEIAKRVGESNFAYIYRDEMTKEREVIGWNDVSVPRWCRRGEENDPFLLEADLVYTGGLRPIGLIAKRLAAGKKTLYVTERWFKPFGFLGVDWPGKWRMMSPRYRKMAHRMVDMLNNPLCMCLAIGPWARRDMISLGVCPSHIVDWGYFVAKGKGKIEEDGRKKNEGSVCGGCATNSQTAELSVLWVGRMLRLKKVDTIIRAVGEISATSARPSAIDVAFDIYGSGPDESRLRKLAAKYGNAIKFHQPVPINEVRGIMRGHDVYVMASDENEGWGAVVNEALEEGMSVFGTFEAGASAAMLPKERLFHAGDWRGLAELLAKEANGELPACSIGKWTAAKAAERLLGLL